MISASHRFGHVEYGIGICCCFLQAGKEENIKQIFKIRHEHINDMPSS